LLVCQRFNCPTSEYEERVFRNCLYWHARLLAPVVRRLNPGFFAEDFKFIRYLGESASFREASVDLVNFHDANLGNRSFWRTALRFRVSGRKASALAQKLLAAAKEANAPAD
jgi:hypothetical protein